MKPAPSPAALLDLPTADDAVLKALHELQNRVNGERFPADPPVPYTQRERKWRQGGTCWVVYAPDTPLPIANAWIDVPAEETKQHRSSSICSYCPNIAVRVLVEACSPQ